MSNRRRLPKPPPQLPVTAMLAPHDGAQIPGGCDHCDAYQTVTVHGHGRDIHKITVRHDDWCPWWRKHRAGKAGQR